MAIVFHCKCGRPLRAGAEAAGKRTRCPSCNEVLTIPGGVPKPAAVGVGAPAAASDPDGLTPDLDWSTLEAPPAADPTRVASNPQIAVDLAHVHVAEVDPPRPDDPDQRQYKVLCQKDQGFSGKFNSVKLEEALNDHARRGWSLKAAVTIHVHAHGGAHDELVMIMER